MTLQNYSLDESKKLNQFCVERGLSDSSKRKYKICLKRYVTFFDMTLEELIEEADKEEETIIRINKRKIRERLIDFRVYLKQNYATNTLKTTMSSVSTFYNHFGITIPKLPPMKYNTAPNDEIEFTDLPTIDHIKQAIENVNTLKHKCLFLFMACSGTARLETANFKFKQFRDAIKEYCPDVETPEDIINALDGKCEGKEPIMPLFKMKREKTGYNYYTIVTPECTQFMINYLKYYGLGLKDDDSFFQLNVNGITSAFRSINNKMNWGKKGTFDFFSPHRLRKFNASVIEDTDLANYIQGRQPTKLKGAYYKKDKLRVREEYNNHIHKFGIYSMYDVMINSDAYQSLLNEKNRLSDELKQTKDEYNNLQDKVNDMKIEIENVSRINDIAKIQDYIVDNEIVNEYNLASAIIKLYKQDVKTEGFEGVTNSYIDDLIMKARNRVVARGSNAFESEIYNDDLWKQINDVINQYVHQYMLNFSLELSEGLRKKLNEELKKYAEYLWKNDEEVDELKVCKIVESIALG